MSVTETFYFNEIFPNYDSWKTLCETADIVDYTDALESEFDKYCYKLLMRHYTHCNIRYFEPDAFICELFNVYENKFKQFKKEKELIDYTYKLSNEDFVKLNESITNMANNPNTEPEDPTKPLQFISAQSYSVQSSNRLQSYLYALNNMPTLNIYKFFKADNKNDMGFDDLFMNVQPINIPIYKQGDF